MTSPPTITAFKRSSQLLGAFYALAGLALAALSALAITKLAQGRIGSGALLLVVSLTVRWMLTLAYDQWSARSARTLRDQWRCQIVTHLRAPRREGERSRGDLALAVEQVSLAPALDVLAVSARVAVLGLALVFWAAGWLATGIIVALLALAIPLYQRAGRRSAALALDYNQRRNVLETRQLELLHHAPELRALGAVGYGADEIAAISDSEHSLALRAIRVALGSSLVTEFLSGVSVGLVAMVVGFALLGGRIALLRALIAVLVTSELFGHVRRYGVEFHRREDADAAGALLDYTPLVVAPTREGLAIDAHDLVTEANPRPLRFSVSPADRLLVTGPSGSGKTTLLHTLLGWRRPVAGELQRTHAPVAYVSTESSLVSGSLWDNLTLGADADEDVVRELLGELDLVGPRFDDLSEALLADGRGMSAGERVRLLVARALLARPALLLLDDVAGVLDHAARGALARVLDSQRELAIIEATVDTPVLAAFDLRIEVRP